MPESSPQKSLPSVAHGSQGTNPLQPPAASQDSSQRQKDKNLHIVQQAERQGLENQIRRTQGPKITSQNVNLEQPRVPSQQRSVSPPEFDSTEGQSILDAFSQGGYQQSDPFNILQYANLQNSLARGQLQSMPNTSTAQVYPDPDDVFAPDYSQQQHDAYNHSYPPQPRVSNQTQQVTRDVSNLQRSPGWIEQLRAVSQTGSVAVEPHLDPRLFQSPSKSHSQTSSMWKQSRMPTPDMFAPAQQDQMASSMQYYNTSPAVLTNNSMLQQQSMQSPTALTNSYEQMQNTIRGQPYGNTGLGEEMGFMNTVSTSDFVQPDGMTRTYGHHWPGSYATSNMVNNNNIRQGSSPYVSPAKMATTKPNVVQVSHPLSPQTEMGITDHGLDSAPVSHSTKRKRPLSKKFDTPKPTPQAKKQITTASLPEEIAQSPISLSAPVPAPVQDSLPFQLPGQRTATSFHRSFDPFAIHTPEISENPLFAAVYKPPKVRTQPDVPSLEKQVVPIRAPAKAPAKGPARGPAKAPAKTPTKAASTRPQQSRKPPTPTLPVLSDLVPSLPMSDLYGNMTAPNPSRQITQPTPPGYMSPYPPSSSQLPSLYAPQTFNGGPVGGYQYFSHNVNQAALYPAQDFGSGGPVGGYQYPPNFNLPAPSSYQNLGGGPIGGYYHPQQPQQPQQPRPISDILALHNGGIQLQENGISAVDYQYARPRSPQPYSPDTHPSLINRTWHPQPCGCCPNGVPSELIRQGSAFRVYPRRRVESVEERLVRALRAEGIGMRKL